MESYGRQRSIVHTKYPLETLSLSVHYPLAELKINTTHQISFFHRLTLMSEGFVLCVEAEELIPLTAEINHWRHIWSQSLLQSR